jgi:hypothetical protein
MSQAINVCDGKVGIGQNLDVMKTKPLIEVLTFG